MIGIKTIELRDNDGRIIRYITACIADNSPNDPITPTMHSVLSMLWIVHSSLAECMLNKRGH